MLRYFRRACSLLGFSVVICAASIRSCCGPSDRRFSRYQANGSIVRNADGTVVGSLLIAQPFTKDEYFQPRPSAPSYDASRLGVVDPRAVELRACAIASRARSGRSSSTRAGEKKGQLVAPDVEAWFQQDTTGGNPHIVAQWADAHNSLAQGVGEGRSDPWRLRRRHGRRRMPSGQGLDQGEPGTPQPKASDLAVRVLRDLLEGASRARSRRR